MILYQVETSTQVETNEVKRRSPMFGRVAKPQT